MNRWIWAGAAAAALTLGANAATTITSWETVACSGMNGISEWVLPHYSNEVIYDGGVSGSTLTNVVRWTADKTYILKGPIFVGSGCVLVIEPGTVVRGYPWTDPNVAKPGTLCVTKGGLLLARGTAQKPIVFTDMWDNNVPGMTPGTVAHNGGAAAPGYDAYAAPWLGADGVRDYSIWQPAFGYWGGVILIGKCPVANGTTPEGAVAAVTTAYAEGLPNSAATQFGNGPLDDDDSSGVLTYLSIRYNGYPISGTSEVNGLSLYAVGRGTEIHHIELMNPIDDAVEWFGGTVNTKYLAAWAFGDDGFDSDEGYRGKAQFLLGVQGAVHDIVNDEGAGSYVSVVGSAWGDKGMEIDGSTGNDRSQPLGLSQWYNLTLIGKGPTDGLTLVGSPAANEASDQVDANSAILCRDNAGPQIRNSIMMDFRGAGVVVEARNDRVLNGYAFDCQTRATTAFNVWPANGNAAFPNEGLYTTQRDGLQLEVRNCLFHNIAGTVMPRDFAEIALRAGYENAGSKDFDPHVSMKPSAGTLAVDFLDAAYGNAVVAASPIAGLSRLLDPNSDLTAKNVYAITNLNPCAANAAVASAPLPPHDGFYSPADYIGAFSPTHNWLAGWTLIAKLGLTDTSMNTNATVGVAAIGLHPSIQFATDAGARYRVDGTTNLVTGAWQTLGHVTGTGASAWFSDDSGAKVQFMRVTRE